MSTESNDTSKKTIGPLQIQIRADIGPARQAINELEADAQAAEAAALRAIAVREVLRDTSRQLAEEFDIPGLLKPLKQLPPQIRAARLEIASAQAAVDAAVEQQKVARANIETAIANEIGSNGKPSFSNADQRLSECRMRRSIDPEYQAALTAMREGLQKLAEAQAMTDLLLQQFEAAKLAAQLTAAQLAAIQG